MEDHGYIIDLGIKGCNAFLKKKLAEKFVAQHRNGKSMSNCRYLLLIY